MRAATTAIYSCPYCQSPCVVATMWCPCCPAGVSFCRLYNTVVAHHTFVHHRAFDVFGSDDRWRAANGEALAVNGHGNASPDLLESGEVEWGAMPNLDLFFERVYRC